MVYEDVMFYGVERKKEKTNAFFICSLPSKNQNQIQNSSSRERFHKPAPALISNIQKILKKERTMRIVVYVLFSFLLVSS
jgi:hypothetical protein